MTTDPDRAAGDDSRDRDDGDSRRRATGLSRRRLLRSGGGVAAASAGVAAGVNGGSGTAAAQDAAEFRQTGRVSHPDDEAAEFDLFGLAVDAGESQVLVGAALQDGAAEDAGAAYLFREGDDGWELDHRFDAGDDARKGARFGQAVALDGDTAFVGASNDSEVGPDAGAVYVFERDADGWARTQKLLPDSFDEEWDLGPIFGSEVALADDLALVSAPASSEFDTANGMVTVYQRGSDGTWEPVDTLYPEESPITYPYYLVEFGYSIAFAGDGILVGAPGDSEAAPDAGAAYLFEPGEEGWDLSRKFLAEDPRANARFGYSVALDGEQALVGAPFTDARPAREYDGAAYLYARDGGDWRLETQLSVAESAETPGGWLGYAVSLRESRALVARPNASSEEESDSGAVHVFTPDGESWTNSERLTPDDPENAELFGISTDLHGTEAVVGDSWYNGPAPQSGTVYLFDRADGTATGAPGFGAVSSGVALVGLVLWALRGNRPVQER